MNPEIESLLRDMREAVDTLRATYQWIKGDFAEIRIPPASEPAGPAVAQYIPKLNTLLARCDAVLADRQEPQP